MITLLAAQSSLGHSPAPALLQLPLGAVPDRALRRHAPAVAVLWPEAPLTASWFNWRCHVSREHLDVLDSAFKAVAGNSINLTEGSGHE